MPLSRLGDFERANELAKQVSIEAVANTARMQILNAQRKWSEVVAEFGHEELTSWPFWKMGEGAFARGKAHYFTKKAKLAEADLQLALQYEPDTRVQIGIRTLMAHNREANLGDDAGALELYRRNFEGKHGIGGADEFRSVDRAAAILAKQEKFDDALVVFEVVDFGKQKGFWLHEMLNSRGRTLLAAGRKNEAATLFRQVMKDKTASAAHRKIAEEALANE